MIKTRARQLATGALALLFLGAMPLTALASHTPRTAHKHHRTHFVTKLTTQQIISFGIEGGNIRPFQVTIDGDGTIVMSNQGVHSRRLVDPKDTLNGFLKLADAEGFFSLPAQTGCQGTLPDVGSRFISIQANGDSKRVSVHGSCLTAFDQLYAVLQAAIGVGQSS